MSDTVCIATNDILNVIQCYTFFLGSCEVVNMSSDQVLEIGGTVLSVALSETCELGLSDSVKCIFNGLEVDGTHMNGSAQCSVPVIGKVGKIPFEVRGSSDVNGDFFHTSELTSSMYVSSWCMSDIHTVCSVSAISPLCLIHSWMLHGVIPYPRQHDGWHPCDCYTERRMR